MRIKMTLFLACVVAMQCSAEDSAPTGDSSLPSIMAEATKHWGSSLLAGASTVLGYGGNYAMHYAGTMTSLAWNYGSFVWSITPEQYKPLIGLGVILESPTVLYYTWKGMSWLWSWKSGGASNDKMQQLNSEVQQCRQVIQRLFEHVKQLQYQQKKNSEKLNGMEAIVNDTNRCVHQLLDYQQQQKQKIQNIEQEISEQRQAQNQQTAYMYQCFQKLYNAFQLTWCWLGIMERNQDEYRQHMQNRSQEIYNQTQQNGDTLLRVFQRELQEVKQVIDQVQEQLSSHIQQQLSDSYSIDDPQQQFMYSMPMQRLYNKQKQVNINQYQKNQIIQLDPRLESMMSGVGGKALISSLSNLNLSSPAIEDESNRKSIGRNANTNRANLGCGTITGNPGFDQFLAQTAAPLVFTRGKRW